MELIIEVDREPVSLLKEKGCHFLCIFGEGRRKWKKKMEDHIAGFLDAVLGWKESLIPRRIVYKGYTNKQILLSKTLLQNNRM